MQTCVREKIALCLMSLMLVQILLFPNHNKVVITITTVIVLLYMTVVIVITDIPIYYPNIYKP